MKLSELVYQDESRNNRSHDNNIINTKTKNNQSLYLHLFSNKFSTLNLS